LQPLFFLSNYAKQPAVLPRRFAGCIAAMKKLDLGVEPLASA
jgi:hypothetical protein